MVVYACGPGQYARVRIPIPPCSQPPVVLAVAGRQCLHTELPGPAKQREVGPGEGKGIHPHQTQHLLVVGAWDRTRKGGSPSEPGSGNSARNLSVTHLSGTSNRSDVSEQIGSSCGGRIRHIT